MSRAYVARCIHRRHLNGLLLAITLLLGLLVWGLSCTEYRWANLWMHVLFAPGIGICGLLAYAVVPSTSPPGRRWLRLGCCLPAMLGGLPAVALLLLALMPPFTLGSMFWLNEQLDAVRIQQAPSPDGTQVAEVYFYPVGAYSRGNGRITVLLTQPALPWLEREVYALPVSYTTSDPQSYVTWRDPTTLVVAETGAQVTTTPLRWRLPPLLAYPWCVLRTLAMVA